MCTITEKTIILHVEKKLKIKNFSWSYFSYEISYIIISTNTSLFKLIYFKCFSYYKITQSVTQSVTLLLFFY